MDIEKTMQFLLEQQARFDARQAEYEARQGESESRQAEFVERHEQARVQINDTLVRVTAAQERTSAILATLTERHVEVAKSHQELEHNVNALVSAVERHIASHG